MIKIALHFRNKKKSEKNLVFPKLKVISKSDMIEQETQLETRINYGTQLIKCSIFNVYIFFSNASSMSGY